MPISAQFEVIRRSVEQNSLNFTPILYGSPLEKVAVLLAGDNHIVEIISSKMAPLPFTLASYPKIQFLFSIHYELHQKLSASFWLQLWARSLAFEEGNSLLILDHYDSVHDRNLLLAEFVDYDVA